MKRVLVSVLGVLLSANLVASQGLIDTSGPFLDVPLTSTYFNPVSFVKGQGWVNGYEDGAFKPYQTINRAEFVKIVVGMTGANLADSKETNLNFKDIDANSWYAPYLKVAIKQQLVAGYPDGTFKPADEISFVEAAKILSRSMGVQSGPGPAWYSQYVEALADAKAIPMTIDNYSKKISRGEMAEMIWRLKSKGAQGDTLTVAQIEAISKAAPIQITFDACGKFDDYAKNDWYKNLSEDVLTIGSDQSELTPSKDKYIYHWFPYDFENYVSKELTEVCYSPNGNIVVIGFNLGNIYKYDIKNSVFYPSKVPEGTSDVEFVTFQKRIGNVIPFTSEYGDAGCMSRHEGQYNFVENKTVITKSFAECDNS